MVSTKVWAEAVLTGVVGVLILAGNLLVILSFWRGPRRLRTFTNYFVVNLAVSDILVGCFSVPFRICVLLEITNSKMSNYKYFISLDILCGTTSILCLTAISLERMFAVKYPTVHYNMRRRPVLVAIAVTWILGIILAAVKLIFGTSGINSPLTLVIFFASFLAPLTQITISYAVIICAIRRVTVSANLSANLSAELRVAKTISVIIGLFVVCWMPFFLLNIFYYFCDSEFCNWLNARPWLVHFAKFMHIANSMMNFFVYAVRSPDFRHTFKALVFNRCSADTLRRRITAIKRTGSVVRGHYGSKKNGNNSTKMLTPQIEPIEEVSNENIEMLTSSSN